MNGNEHSDEDYSEKEDKKGPTKKRRSRMTWEKQADDYLLTLKTEEHLESWTLISERMNKKFSNTCYTAKKCRSRWKSSLDPDLDKKELKESEILLLLAHHHHCKNSWHHITLQFSGRHTNLLRNSFYGLFRKLLRNIQQLKKPLVGFSPAFFVQAIYMSKYIMEVHSLLGKIDTNKDIAPEYIFDLVKNSQLLTERSVDYLNLITAKLKNLIPDNELIRTICDLNPRELMGGFIDNVMNLSLNTFKADKEISHEEVIKVLENAYKKFKTHCSSSFGGDGGVCGEAIHPPEMVREQPSSQLASARISVSAEEEKGKAELYSIPVVSSGITSFPSFNRIIPRNISYPFPYPYGYPRPPYYYPYFPHINKFP